MDSLKGRKEFEAALTIPESEIRQHLTAKRAEGRTTSSVIPPLFFLVFWAGLAGVTGWYLHLNYLFAHDSVSSIGVVEQKYVSRGRGRIHFFTATSGDKMGTVIYDYIVADRTLSTTVAVQPDTYDSLRVGGSVPMRYLANDPSQTRIDLPAENKFVSLMTYGLAGITAQVTLGVGIVWREYLRAGSKTGRMTTEWGINPNSTPFPLSLTQPHYGREDLLASLHLDDDGGGVVAAGALERGAH